jgi:NAD(P)-dependent dehydrogenase (short-subunit alcohol dehydrogenase family)
MTCCGSSMSCQRFMAYIVLFIACFLGVAKQFFLTKKIHDWNFPTLKNKIFIVTGSTSGIGFETVKWLYKNGATVVMANRNVEKSERVAPSNGKGKLIHLKLDLASFESTREFAKKIKIIYGDRSIDALILNAATTADNEITKDGIDMQYQVNHLSHFLLSNLLIQQMKVKSRIIFVSSAMHYLGTIDFKAFSFSNKNLKPHHVGGGRLYSATKLMNTMAAIELDILLKKHYEDEVTIAVSSVHPGFVISELDEDGKSFKQIIMPYLRQLLARQTNTGALTQLRVATDPALSQTDCETNGCYFSDDCINYLCKGLISSEESLNQTIRQWLWKENEQLVGGNIGLLGNKIL